MAATVRPRQPACTIKQKETGSLRANSNVNSTKESSFRKHLPPYEMDEQLDKQVISLLVGLLLLLLLMSLLEDVTGRKLFPNARRFLAYMEYLIL